MNARDFCFWLQGYTELTGSNHVPKKAWKLILEHLELANRNAGDSREEFEGVVEMLSGFTSIAGTETPTDEQWARITNIVQDVFVKVTSNLDESEEDDQPSTEEIMKEVLDEIRKKDIAPMIPPYQPYPVQPWDTRPDLPTPWKPNDPWAPTIICSNEPQTQQQTDIIDSLKQACQTIDDLHNNEPSNSVFCGGSDLYASQIPNSDGTGMYDVGINLAHD